MPSPTIASLLKLAAMMLILLFFVIIPTPSAASPLREGGLALYTREAVLYKKLALGKSLLTGLTNISAIVIAFFAVLYLIHKMLLRPSQQRLMARVIVPPPPLRGRPAAGTIIMSEEAYQRYMHDALPLRLSPSRPAGNPLHRQPVFPWPLFTTRRIHVTRDDGLGAATTLSVLQQRNSVRTVTKGSHGTHYQANSGGGRAVSGLSTVYYTMKWVLESVLPDKKDGKVKEKQLDALKRMGHQELELDEYERTVANEVIHPDDIKVTFKDIGGLDHIITTLRESVIYPLLYPNLFTSSSSLLGAPKGVLLFGPPGCGKTMMAKALAKESGATFINIAASVLTNKWYGESNKLVAGLFSLARKTQPSIIFIDEIDSFLRERAKGDHEVTGMMKAEFMTLWDGLTTSTDRILVLGATNRPNDIDSAILRRMPKRFAVGLPNYDQRLRILTLMLQDTKTEPNFSIEQLARATVDFSGSDLRELCRNAAMVPVREYMRSSDTNQELLAKGQLEGFDLRPLRVADFFVEDGTSPLPPRETEAFAHIDDPE